MLAMLDFAKPATSIPHIREDTWIGNRTLFVVHCSATKSSEKAPAAHLYSSDRFSAHVKFATAVSGHYVVASGKYGLLYPSSTIETYDQHLFSGDTVHLEKWRSLCRGFLEKATSEQSFDNITVLGDSDYAERLFLQLQDLTSIPVIRISLSAEKIERLTERIKNRRRRLLAFYRSMRLTMPIDNWLAEKLPEKGVYYFLDPSEPSSVFRDAPRLVRIGTHGVSRGSRATLRQRLRTHFGTKGGLGNHRSSIFRLHVGECLLRRARLSSKVPTWGSAMPTNSRDLEREREIESEVSAYIRSLLVGVRDVPGISDKCNRRAQIEYREISDCTADRIILDKSTPDWLGNFSMRPQIRASGLWNVSLVGQPTINPVQLELL